MLDDRRGSVIAEALIAVVVMSVGITVLMQALMNNARVVDAAQDYGRAWILLNEKLEEKVHFDKLNVSIKRQVANKPLERFEYDLTFKKITQDHWSGLNQLDIAVSWPNENKRRQVSLRTILPNDNTTQTSQSIFYN